MIMQFCPVVLQHSFAPEKAAEEASPTCTPSQLSAPPPLLYTNPVGSSTLLCVNVLSASPGPAHLYKLDSRWSDFEWATLLLG